MWIFGVAIVMLTIYAPLRLLFIPEMSWLGLCHVLAPPSFRTGEGGKPLSVGAWLPFWL